MRKCLKFIILIGLLFCLAACSPQVDSKKIDDDIQHPEITRNCPYLLSAKITGEENNQVIISPVKNEAYNPAFGDACRGDFKRILDDLPEFAEYFEKFGANIVIDFGDIFYAHDGSAGFVRRTRRDLSRALNGYRGINHHMQKDDHMGRSDEFGTEPFDSDIMVPISNRVLKEDFYQDYEHFLNRFLNPFGLWVLSLELSPDTTICRNSKKEICSNDFDFPSRWNGLVRETYALGGVRGQWRLTTLDTFTPDYRNCPVIVRHRESSKGLHLWTDQNEGFDANLPNECEGRLETVWQDIEFFEPLMEKHAPNILGSFHVGFYLKHFPDTQLEISEYLSRESQKEFEKIDLGDYENQLDEVSKTQIQYISLFREKLPEYVSQIHTPIINGYLKPYGVEMEAYDLGEKVSFCLVENDNCLIYFPRNDELMRENPNLTIFFLGTWDYHWNTKNITP